MGRTTAKIATSPWDLDPSNTRFLGTTRIYPPMGILIGLAVLQGSYT